MQVDSLGNSFVSHEVEVRLGDRSYSILIGPGVLSEAHRHIERTFGKRPLFIVADDNCYDLLGMDLQSMLKDDGFSVEAIIFPHGEQSKNLATVEEISRELVRKGADRHSVLLAVGGGVTGDIGGFVASIYMRGIPFVQIPTTLLAQVDSSVGGKTGVDLPEGKNLVGTFYQPGLVLTDIGVLATLPRKELINGLSEVVKYGAIWDEEFFAFLERHYKGCLELDPDIIGYIVKRSCEIKAEVVSRDEREGGLRRILNFGHTIGHAIEAVSEFSISHGQAVAMGMVAAGKLSSMKGLLDSKSVARLKALLEALELPTVIPNDLDEQRIIELIRHDKKARSGKVHFVLLKALGETVITSNVTDQEVLEAVRPWSFT